MFVSQRYRMNEFERLKLLSLRKEVEGTGGDS